MRIQQRNHFAPLALVSLVTVGCSSMRPTPSDFLADVSLFEAESGRGSQLHYDHPDGPEPVPRAEVALIVTWDPKDDRSAENPHGLRLAEAFEESLRVALEDKEFTVTEPGPETLDVVARVTDFDVSSVVLNVVTTIGLFVPVDNGGVTAEVRVEAPDDRLVLARSNAGNGGITQFLGYFQRLGHARSFLDAWAEEIADELVIERRIDLEAMGANR